MATVNPAVRDARDALTLFNVKTRRQARVLLSTWARRAELSPADVAAIVASYGTRGGAR